jgi:hypothetical protein
VAEDGEGREEARPLLDAQQVQRHEEQRAQAHVGRHQHHPALRGRVGPEEGARERPAQQDHRSQERGRGQDGEEERRAGQAPPLRGLLQVVVHAEEPGVHAQAHQDLGQRAEEQQQGQVAVVGGREEGRVDGQQQEVDGLGEHVGRAVDERVAQQRADLAGQGGRGRGFALGHTRARSDVK